MQLRHFLESVKPAHVEGPTAIDVTGLAFEARLVKPGMAFFALKTAQGEGDNEIERAIDRGAAVIVCEQRRHFKNKAVVAQVPDIRIALARAADAFFGHPSSKLMVIGVIGEYGRASVAFLLKQILEKAGLKTGLAGRMGCEIGERRLPANASDPESLEIQALLDHMVKAGCQAAVIEVGAKGIENSQVAGVHFNALVHVSAFAAACPGKPLSETKAERTFRKLFESQPASTRSVSSLIEIREQPAGDAGSEMAAVIRHGPGRKAVWQARKAEFKRDGLRLETTLGEREIILETPVIGRENAGRLLAALSAAYTLGFSVEAIQLAARALKNPPGSLEMVSSSQKFGVYIDGGRSQADLRKTLRLLREITPGRILIAFGCGAGHSAEARFEMGEIAAALADFTIITTDNPANEPPAGIAADVERGFCNIRNTSYRVETDRARAIAEIIVRAKPGDAVLIAGKGLETTQRIEDAIIPFDDREHAKACLRPGIRSGPRLAKTGHRLKPEESREPQPKPRESAAFHETSP